jgi:Fe2+ or Zn2+ uptake regulation protein
VARGRPARDQPRLAVLMALSEYPHATTDTVARHARHARGSVSTQAVYDDVDRALGETPCLTPFPAHGLALEEAEVVFWDYCPSCQTIRATPKETRS